MDKKEPTETVKKNLLDLQYNKYLQYYTTTVIILFTYVIGMGIAFITQQIDPTNVKQLFVVGIVTIAITTIIILSLLHFKGNMENILDEIKKLKL